MKKHLQKTLKFREKCKEVQKKRHKRILEKRKSIFAREAHKQQEKTFFWKVVSLSTLGLFFLSLAPRFATSSPDFLAPPESINNTLEERIIFGEDGFLMKPELITEVGDRSDVPGSVHYLVKPNDTISSLSKRFGVDENTILQNNNFLKPEQLKVGTVLSIPSVNGVIHQVKKGETLSGIAKKYKVDTEIILAQNTLEDAGSLRAGDEILIPGAKRSKPKPPKPTYKGGYGSAQNIAYAGNTKGKLLFPTKGIYTQGFHYGHYAVDIAGKRGTPVYASESGTVVRADTGWNGGYGNVVIIDHGNGLQTLYAHNEKIYVRVGDTVNRGQPISAMGNSGRVYGRTGVHVHFEVRINGTKKNPTRYF